MMEYEVNTSLWTVGSATFVPEFTFEALKYEPVTFTFKPMDGDGDKKEVTIDRRNLKVTYGPTITEADKVDLLWAALSLR